jgi:hypothetical protein
VYEIVCAMPFDRFLFFCDEGEYYYSKIDWKLRGLPLKLKYQENI